MCQQKKNKNSNQAQRSGDFMRQKWRIYGLSDKWILWARGAVLATSFESRPKKMIVWASPK
jgi:hypothetical protein